MGKTKASTVAKDSRAARNPYHPPKFISPVRTQHRVKPSKDVKIPRRSNEQCKSPIEEWKDTLVKIAEFQVAISKDTHFIDRFNKGTPVETDSPEQATASKKKDPKFRVFMGFNTAALDDESQAKFQVHTYNRGASIEVPYKLKVENQNGFKYIPVTAIVDDFEGWLDPACLSTMTKIAPTPFKFNFDAWLGAICKFYLDCHIKKFFPDLNTRSIKKKNPFKEAVRLEKNLNPVGAVIKFPDFNKLVSSVSKGTHLRASREDILQFVRNRPEYFQWSHLSSHEETGKIHTLYGGGDEEGTSRHSDIADVIGGEKLPNKRSDDGKVSKEESTLMSANAGNTSCPSLQSQHYDTCTAEGGVTNEASDASAFMSPNGADTNRPWQGTKRWREILRTRYKKSAN